MSEQTPVTEARQVTFDALLAALERAFDDHRDLPFAHALWAALSDANEPVGGTAFAYSHPYPCPLNNPSASIGDVCRCAASQPDLAALRAAVGALPPAQGRFTPWVDRAAVLALLSDATDAPEAHEHDWVVTVEYDEGRTENVARCIVCGAFRPAPESPE